MIRFRSLFPFFVLFFLLGSCKSLDYIVMGKEGKDVLQIATFGSETVDYAALDKVQLKGFNLTDFNNKLVANEVRKFQSPAALKRMQTALDRASTYMETIREIFKEVGVPEDLSYLPIIESGFQTKATSHKKAVGVWQFVPGTARHYKLGFSYWHDDRQDVVKSTRAAAYHLKYLYGRLGNWLLVLAAYNAGEGRIRRSAREAGSNDYWVMMEKKTLPKETAYYVPKFIAASLIAKNPGHYGVSLNIKRGVFQKLRPFEVEDATDVHLLAENAQLSLQEFESYNTALKHWMTPPSTPYTVYIPEENFGRFLENWQKVKPEDRITYRRYFVGIGENLSAIARKFQMPVEPIVQVNKIKKKNEISAGKYIFIPIRGLEKAKDVDRENADDLKFANHSGADGRKEGRPTLKRASFPPAEANQSKEDVFFHEVTEGDSFYSIARRYRVDLRKLLEWNHLESPNAIRYGMLLLVRTPKDSGV